MRKRKVSILYQDILDNLRAISIGILEIRKKEAYWREKWRKYKGRSKWRKVEPVKDRDL